MDVGGGGSSVVCCWWWGCKWEWEFLSVEIKMGDGGDVKGRNRKRGM